MRLSQLGLQTPDGHDLEITGITEDSRRITPGMLFVAVRGATLDGHAYIEDAIARGAAAVVAERGEYASNGVPIVFVPSARRALATAAARFYSRPSERLRIIGFTGTFGKTSTSDILRALLEASGRRTGVLGSLGARYNNFHDAGNGLTTPAPVELHRALHGLREAGAETVIMEVTSHALRMGRVSGLTFAGGLLAAIMPGEHTDFHSSYEDYVSAKRLFLDYLEADAILAFDADNQAARSLAADAGVRVRAGFSLGDSGAAVAIRNVTLDATGAHFTVDGEPLHSTLLGRGHLLNVGLALAYAFQAGVGIDRARPVLRGLEPLRRRMERYVVAGRTILDDTAAHPDSLRATFEVAGMLAASLRQAHPDSRTLAVYAVRGNRGAAINHGNALALAELAAQYGLDRLIITASSDSTDAVDRATDQEMNATRQALDSRGRSFAWHDTLQEAMHAALTQTRDGDLIVLAGAQGMNQGRNACQ